MPQVFNGGSDFNEPVKRCLDRLHDAGVRWVGGPDWVNTERAVRHKHAIGCPREHNTSYDFTSKPVKNSGYWGQHRKSWMP